MKVPPPPPPFSILGLRPCSMQGRPNPYSSNAQRGAQWWRSATISSFLFESESLVKTPDKWWEAPGAGTASGFQHHRSQLPGPLYYFSPILPHNRPPAAHEGPWWPQGWRWRLFDCPHVQPARTSASKQPQTDTWLKTWGPSGESQNGQSTRPVWRHGNG